MHKTHGRHGSRAYLRLFFLWNRLFLLFLFNFNLFFCRNKHGILCKHLIQIHFRHLSKHILHFVKLSLGFWGFNWLRDHLNNFLLFFLGLIVLRAKSKVHRAKARESKLVRILLLFDFFLRLFSHFFFLHRLRLFFLELILFFQVRTTSHRVE